jgi:hypothetical protein
LLFVCNFPVGLCRELTRPMQTQREWNSSVRALHGCYILLTRAHIWLSNEPDRLRQFLQQWSGALADFLERSVSRQIRENEQKIHGVARTTFFDDRRLLRFSHTLGTRLHRCMKFTQMILVRLRRARGSCKKCMRFLCAFLTFCVE